MKYNKWVLLGLSCISLITPTIVSATIILDGAGGSNTTATLNDGASIDGTVVIPQSSFSNVIATSGAGPASDGTHSDTILISDIPIEGGLTGGFLKFIYDQQETGGTEPLELVDIVLSVGSTAIWNYDEILFGSILLNDTSATPTDSPLGNGSDMELQIPVNLFDGLGFMGSDLLTFSWTQALSNNGGDEWVVAFGEGDGSICTDCIIGEPPVVVPPSAVPEPGMLGLFGIGLLGLGLARRRRPR